MLHLFGSRLGQKGSTLYVGAPCECTAGTTPRTPKQKNAMAIAKALVHPNRKSINDSSSSSVGAKIISEKRATGFRSAGVSPAICVGWWKQKQQSAYSCGCGRAFPSPFFSTNF